MAEKAFKKVIYSLTEFVQGLSPLLKMISDLVSDAAETKGEFLFEK